MSFHTEEDKGFVFQTIAKYVLPLKNGKVCPVNEAYQKSQ